MTNRNKLDEIVNKRKKIKELKILFGKALIESDNYGYVTKDNLNTQNQILTFVSDIPLKISVIKSILAEAEKNLKELTELYIKDIQTRSENRPKTKSGLLSETQASKILGVHKETLARQRRARTGPEYTQIGKRILYSQEALEEYVKKHTT